MKASGLRCLLKGLRLEGGDFAGLSLKGVGLQRLGLNCFSQQSRETRNMRDLY